MSHRLFAAIMMGSFLSAFCFPANAWELIEQGGMGLNLPSVMGSTRPLLTAGASIEGKMPAKDFTAEGGIRFVARDLAPYTVMSIEFPLVIRWHFLEDRLSVGLGGYFAHFLNMTMVDAATGATELPWFDDRALRRFDAGAVGSLRWKFVRFLEVVELSAEVRYHLGFLNASINSSPSYFTKRADFLLGLHLLFGEIRL